MFSQNIFLGKDWYVIDSYRYSIYCLISLFFFAINFQRPAADFNQISLLRAIEIFPKYISEHIQRVAIKNNMTFLWQYCQEP